MKCMMKIFTTAAVLALAAAIVFGAAAPKTTGDSYWMNGGNTAHTTFEAIAQEKTGDSVTAKGSFTYNDGPNNYTMDVKFLKVVGNTAVFAGQITTYVSGCCTVGDWILIQIQDNGEPGIGTDQIWGADLGSGPTEDNIKTLVEAMSTPAGGPFTIIGGNMQVQKN